MERVPRSTPVPERLQRLVQLAREGRNHPVVIELAGSLGRMADAFGLARVETFLEAVQRLPFVRDPLDADYYRRPIETLAHGGDCASKAALLAALLEADARFARRWDHESFARVRPARAVRFVWEECGDCREDHVRLAVQRAARLPGAAEPWEVFDATEPRPVGERAVSWEPTRTSESEVV